MLRWIRKYNKHYLMLLPFFVFYSIFFLYPAISGVFISFTNWDSIHPPKWVGLDNYANIVTSPAFAIAAINLIKYVCIAIPLGITLAFCVAVLVDSYKEFRLGENISQCVFRTGHGPSFSDSLNLEMVVFTRCGFS